MNKVIQFLDNLILKGKVPGLKYIKLILSLIPLLAIIVIFDPDTEKEFANFGWNILFATILIRPVSTILPRLGIICRMMLVRKQLGIIAGTFILFHGIGFFLKNNMPISTLFTSQSWDFKSFFAWGLLGAIMIIPPLLTSNNFLQNLLGKWWKPIQQISYLLFIFGGIHIYLYKNDPVILAELITWAILWILAWKKVIIWPMKKTPKNCS